LAAENKLVFSIRNTCFEGKREDGRMVTAAAEKPGSREYIFRRTEGKIQGHPG